LFHYSSLQVYHCLFATIDPLFLIALQEKSINFLEKFTAAAISFADEREISTDASVSSVDELLLSADEPASSTDERRSSADESKLSADESASSADERLSSIDERDLSVNERRSSARIYWIFEEKGQEIDS